MSESEKIDDGGPAFPESRITQYMVTGRNGQMEPLFETIGGMSLRDWIAGQALVGSMLLLGVDGEVQDVSPETIAAHSYRIADAMLAARKGQP